MVLLELEMHGWSTWIDHWAFEDVEKQRKRLRVFSLSHLSKGHVRQSLHRELFLERLAICKPEA